MQPRLQSQSVCYEGAGNAAEPVSGMHAWYPNKMVSHVADGMRSQQSSSLLTLVPRRKSIDRTHNYQGGRRI